jgi:hypothetical protein
MLAYGVDTHIFNMWLVLFCVAAIAVVIADAWGGSRRSLPVAVFRCVEVLAAGAIMAQPRNFTLEYILVVGWLAALLVFHAVTPMFWRSATS